MKTCNLLKNALVATTTLSVADIARIQASDHTVATTCTSPVDEDEIMKRKLLRDKSTPSSPTVTVNDVEYVSGQTISPTDKKNVYNT
jgi:hypothetical protein